MILYNKLSTDMHKPIPATKQDSVSRDFAGLACLFEKVPAFISPKLINYKSNCSGW